MLKVRRDRSSEEALPESGSSQQTQVYQVRLVRTLREGMPRRKLRRETSRGSEEAGKDDTEDGQR